MQCCFAVLRFQRIQISNQLLASSKSKIIKVNESFLSNILNNVLARDHTVYLTYTVGLMTKSD